MFDLPKGFEEQFVSPASSEECHYLDSAATAIRLKVAVEKQFEIESSLIGNPNRGGHAQAARASIELEAARDAVASSLGASLDLVAFCSGATEAANLLARGLALAPRDPGPIVVTALEHHSNFLPWQRLAAERGSPFIVIGLTPSGDLDLDAFEAAAKLKPSMVAISAMSNVNGACPPISWMSEVAKSCNPDCLVLVDAAQAVGFSIDRSGRLWGGDAAFFSGHKAHASFGAGAIVFASKRAAERFAPPKLGGGIVRSIGSDWQAKLSRMPAAIESGTLPLGSIASLGAAMFAASKWNSDALMARRKALSERFSSEARSIPGVRVHEAPSSPGGLVSFSASWAHPHDLGTFLESKSLSLRAGHMCALPALKSLGEAACLRMSLSPHSLESSVEALIVALSDARRFFHG